MPALNQSDLLHAGNFGGSPYRILLVEHDPYACHIRADALIRDGYQVNAAEDGEAGWEELQAHHYHLLITGHKMPKVSGLQLVRKVRAARMALRVVMVARTVPVWQLAGKHSLQLEAMLLKPLSVDALLNTVRLVLGVSISSPGQLASSSSQWPSMPAGNFHPFQGVQHPIALTTRNATVEDALRLDQGNE